MSDAYRSTTNTCPTCAAPLRAFGTRLVCDQCEGMMLTSADFIHACEEVAGILLPLSFREESPTETACPRCSVPLVACKVNLGDKKLKGVMLRCAQHGLWCGPEELPAIFAIVGRTWAPHSAGGARGAGKSIDGLPMAQHRPASGRLAISKWHVKRRKRTSTPVPQHDTYRDVDLACPACPPSTPRLRFTGDRWTCSACHGLFVQKPALEALIEEMSGAPYELAAVAGAQSSRPCPACHELMTEDHLASVTIDRCDAHGLWFDQHELQTALVVVGAPEPGGVFGWLKRLF